MLRFVAVPKKYNASQQSKYISITEKMEYALFYQVLKGQINRFIAPNTQPELKHESMFRCCGGGGRQYKELDLRSDMLRRGTKAVLLYLYYIKG
jgi:hypothetical protein